VSAPNLDAFRDAVRWLHQAKDAAYGNAWKKRGEVLSILANVARKVDRLEYALEGASASKDETLLDTAVDLVVYVLKYQTFLADGSAEVASVLFADAPVKPPFSDGTAGFDYLLAGLDLDPLQAAAPQLAEVASSVVTSFAKLEACFQDPLKPCSTPTRLDRVRTLTRAAVDLVGTLRHGAPRLYGAFLTT
jgi:hypothetical protein